MKKLDLQQILKETSESVSNGHSIQQLEEWKLLIKKLDSKDDKKSLKYAINILGTVIKLKKKRKVESSKIFRGIFIGVLMILFIHSVSASISYKENGEMFLQGGSNNPLSIKNGLNITTGHLFISAGDLHLDGDLIHDLGDVSFSGGSFDVAGEITATGFISQILKTTAGTLKIQPSADADVTLFSSSDVGDADDGRELKIWRNAVEGNNYIRIYVNAGENAMTHSNTNMLFQNAAGKNIQFNSGQHIYLNLGDSAGSDEVRIRDNGGMEIMTIDSNGNTWSRGDLSIGVSNDVLIQANGDSYFNGGNVGIGGLIPNSRLSIEGNESGDHTNNAGLAMSNIAVGGDTWYLRTGANGTFTPSGGFSIADTSAYRFVIDETGKIGIGTITPLSKLEVNGNVSLNNVLFVANSGFVGVNTTDPQLPLDIRTTDDNQAIFFDMTPQSQGTGGGLAFGGKYNDAGGEAMAGRIGVQKTNSVSGDVGFNMIFETQDSVGSITERMVLQSDGNVGIGEENPISVLDINGGGSNGLVVQSANLGSEYAFHAKSSNGNTIIWAGGDGRIGFGTATPTIFIDAETNENIVMRLESLDNRADIIFQDPTGSAYIGVNNNNFYIGYSSNSPDRAIRIDEAEGVYFTNLSGTGNDYACLDSTGKLFRSNIAC